MQASPLGELIAEQSGGTEIDRAGRVVVEPDLSVKGHPNVFVLGDMAAVPNVPGVAQGAIQGAKYATNIIKRTVAGTDDASNRVPFKYFDKGSMATVSRHSAVAKVGPIEFSGYIAWWSLSHPDRVPAGEPPSSLMTKLRRSGSLIPCTLLIVFIVWVLIAGWATATECAAFGVLGALVIAAAGRSLSWRSFVDSLTGATRLSCMIMFILAGAAFLTKTMAFTGIPRELAEAVAAANLSPYALITLLVVVYLVLGTALDGISMIVLTSAVVLPMVQKAGFDLVWFGIFVIMLIEIAEITPPVGFNLFVLQSMTGIDSNRIARATLPFFACLLLGIVLITVFPAIVTGLPDALMGASR